MRYFTQYQNQMYTYFGYTTNNYEVGWKRVVDYSVSVASSNFFLLHIYITTTLVENHTKKQDPFFDFF